MADILDTPTLSTYRTLKSIFHEKGEAAAQAELVVRLNGYSTYSTAFRVGEHHLFYVATRQIIAAHERILSRERTLAVLLQALPSAALSSYLTDLTIRGIIATDEIEGVRTTRTMITDALASDNTSGKRAREFMILLSHGGNQNSIPTTVQQVRAIYDQLLQDQIKPEDTPDGRFFRSQVVSIFDGSNKPVHRGVTPESAIIENVTTALEHAQSPEIPPIFSALVAHFMFEYTHPFYDGNGRFGRYLLSAHLGRAMTLPAVLTLAITLNKERARYYKAFSKVENPLNYGDATSFLLTMLGMVEAAQNDILDELNAKKKDLEQLSRTVDSCPAHTLKPRIFCLCSGRCTCSKTPWG